MKICVYAICKNEEKFIERWYESVKEADGIYVLDTGSTDNSVKLLKSLGVVVRQEIISPWRFDIARNKSLEIIPDDFDICICLDLDEVLEKGWSKTIKSLWKDGLTRLRYVYNWSLDKNNQPIISFYGEKIHKRKGFTWVNPVHEILKYKGEEKYLYTDKVIVNHYPDSKKSRSSYLPLLELAVREDPRNDRNMHYLGREYMYYGKYEEAISTLERHLSLESATWKDERCASMRFIARCYMKLNRPREALMWSNLAIKESPYLRDPYMEKALITYELKKFKETEKLCREALKIKKHPKTYINEVFTTDLNIYDILSVVCFYNGKYRSSLRYVKLALELDKDNERLLSNKKLIEEYINNN